MCGILGTVDRPFDERALDLIRHRGPDGSGMADLAVGRHRVQLGHRRLAIIDLSPAGHQPMATPCGRYVLTFNGEIYNHAEIRAALAPREFRGHSDTETILHAMAANGVDAVRQFNGIFAFALADAEHGKLFLVRDPFGVKPLYYWAGPREFAFSSEIRVLRDMVEDSVDPEALAELLRLRYLPAPDTLFKSIRKVRPGHIVEVDLRSPRMSFIEYPYLEAAPEQASSETREQAAEHYGFLLERAIRRQLLSDVEVGVLLSGGIDSALVAHYAQAHASYRMKAFTVGFNAQDDADEVAEAAETARALGLEHCAVRIGFEEFADLLPRVAGMVEEPLATTSVVPMYYLARLASRHVKVVLSGQGADEALGGYRRYRAERLRPFVPRTAVPFMGEAARLLRLNSGALERGLASIGERDDVRRFADIYTVFTPDQIRGLTGQEETLATERIRYFFNLLRCSAQRDSAARMMSLDLRMNLADDLLLYTDKITMQHSLECRVPLLDLDLVRYLESLPSRYRLGLLHGKLVHRRFARRVLPNGVIGRRKKGFLSPTRRWFEKTNLVRGLLLEKNSRFASHFDLRRVEKVIDEYAAGKDRGRQLFLLVSLYYWLGDAPAYEAAPSGPRLSHAA